jgi:tetratricopeptide (TPR) repeat protein
MGDDAELGRLTAFAAQAEAREPGFGFFVARTLEARNEAVAASKHYAELADRATDARLRYFLRLEAARSRAGVDWPAGRALYEALTREVPERAEAWFQLGRRARTDQRYQDAWRDLEKASACARPTDDPLADPLVYDVWLPDERSIVAYWTGRYAESLEICNSLLARGVPISERERVLSNRRFSLEKVYPGAMQLEIVEVSTVGRCKIACPYCPQDKLQAAYDGPHRLTLEDFEVIVDKLRPICRLIDFSGFVEPFLNRECIDMIEHAHARGFGIRVFTTLEGARLEDVKRLAAIPLQHLCLHLPTPSMKMRVDARYVDKLRWAIENLAYDDCLLEEELDPELVAAIPALADVQKRILVSRAQNVVDLQGKLVSGHTTGRALDCLRRSFDHPVLMPDGRAALCCQDYGLEHVVGNLLRDDLATFLASTEYVRIRAALDGRGAERVLCHRCEYASPRSPQRTQQRP